MWWLLTCVVASVIVLLDLFQTFEIPLKPRQQGPIFFWLLVFVGLNAFLALFVHCYVFDNAQIAGLDPWLRSVLIGISYVAISRTKIATLKISGKSIDLGFELLYSGWKRVIYKRVNRTTIQIQYQEARSLVEELSLKELARRAKFAIDRNKLLKDKEKQDSKTWLLGVLTDPQSSDEEKELVIAHFINYGETSDTTW